MSSRFRAFARRHRVPRRAVHGAAHLATAALLLSVPLAVVLAEPAAGPSPDIVLAAREAVLAAPNDLPTVVGNLRGWLMSILAAIATLFLVLAGVYWTSAGGDTTQVEKAKTCFRNALIGYGLAVLAPVLLTVLQGIVGG
ncbi:pilin [Actinoplanes sp. NPDC051475]|uniref:pilin n=1 Tax=Actinoplanes sp. NPDC051475 TaxID=3157225 RepID=UPI003450B001